MKQRRLLSIAVAAVAAFALTACGDDDDGDGDAASRDFTSADLEGLNFAPGDLPDMEYQRDSSGLNAFTADQLEEAEEEGDRSGVQLVADLEQLGLAADHASQFFPTSRDSELSFVEGLVFLFADADAAEEAVDVLREADAENLAPADEIDAPDLGEQAFGWKGEFDGFPVYSFGWRVGDVIELVSVAPGDENAGPESTIALAEQLEAKAAEDGSAEAPSALSFAEEDLPDLVPAASEAPPDTEVDRELSGANMLEREGLPENALRRIQSIGYAKDYGVQFVPTSRDAPFAEALVLLFDDEQAAVTGLDRALEVHLEFFKPAEEIPAEGLGESSWGVSGNFDGKYPTGIFAVRTGNVIQIATVAGANERASVDEALALAEQLEALAQG